MRRVVWVILLASLVAGLVTSAGLPTRAEPAYPPIEIAVEDLLVEPADAPASARDFPRWRGVLHRLDLRRARAFARADQRLLRTVYAAGSSALTEDRATLTAYRERGFRVSLRMALLEVRAVRSCAKRVDLHVVDQLVAASVVDRAEARTDLPRDLPTARRITLIETTDGWRIAAVLAARRDGEARQVKSAARRPPSRRCRGARR